MIVDDQPFNLMTLKEIMKAKFGLANEIDQATNGQEALDLVKADTQKNKAQCMNYSSYKLIIMDCQMPIMDGYEATR